MPCTIPKKHFEGMQKKGNVTYITFIPGKLIQMVEKKTDLYIILKYNTYKVFENKVK